MRASMGWLRGHAWGLTVGVVVTLAVMEAYHAGFFQRLSHSLLDWKFRHVNRIDDDDRIVMIDLNDYAVERVHSWPWPRKLNGELVDALHELGARAVLMDMYYSEPTPKRIVDPRLAADYDVDHQGRIVGEVNFLDAVDDDGEFAASLRRAGNVYLGATARLHRPGQSPDVVRRRAFELFDREPTATFDRFEAILGPLLDRAAAAEMDLRQQQQSDRRQMFDAFRCEYLLEKNYTLTSENAATLLGIGHRRVQERWAQAKRDVARRLVTRLLEVDHDLSWPDVYAKFLPLETIDTPSADKQDLLGAYRATRSVKLALQAAPPVPASLVGGIQSATDLIMPLDRFAEAARAALVVLQSDSDDVMRRVPMVASADGRLIKHLGFALSCDVLDIDESTIRMEPGRLMTMDNRDRSRRWQFQVDEAGRTLIQWHINPAEPQWQNSFVHVPVARVMDIPKMRRDIVREQGIAANFIAPYVEARYGDARAAYVDYERVVRERRDAISDWHAPDRVERVRELDERVEGIEKESVDAVLESAAQIQEFLDSGGDEAELDDASRRFLALAEDHRESRVLQRTRETVDDLTRELDRQSKRLRSEIAGKICLFGYTATAVADTVTSPVFGEMPGVLAHANVINSMLTGRFPWTPPASLDLALIAAAGLCMTAVTALRTAWVSLTALVLIIAALHILTFYAFNAHDYNMDIVGPLIASFFAWAFVTLYRQLTEERQKRAFSRSLAQYTSPEIAGQLAERVARGEGTMDLAPVPRDVTCFFSDLKGFTSISERLGAARTKEILNPYLESMSDALLSCHGMINKFMGDGIFAFFNAPVHPVKNHGRAACEAALVSFAALENLKKRLGGGDLDKEVNALSMRIGLNSGEVFVGDYGSKSKLDYTCIGDTVNLAARLEPACKPFGVQCMISEQTRAMTDGAYVLRHLGGLQVVGKKLAVPVYELLGRPGEVDAETADYAALFGEAVAKFQSRDWPAALSLFTRCRSFRPSDLALDLFEANIHMHQQSPPPDDWNQAIELTTK